MIIDKMDAIAAYLVAQGLGTLGVDLFVGEMPQSSETGILLMSDPTLVDQSMPKWRATSFRVVTRAKSRSAAFTLAARAGEALTLRGETQLGALLVKQCWPVTDPKDYRRGAGNLWEWETDLDIWYVMP